MGILGWSKLYNLTVNVKIPYYTIGDQSTIYNIILLLPEAYKPINRIFFFIFIHISIISYANFMHYNIDRVQYYNII